MPFPAFVVISFAGAAATLLVTYGLSDRPGLAAAAAFAGAAGLALFHGPGYFSFPLPLDDAFITLRYSQHLADGLGPNWNSEGRVEGYTSFLWMGLLAGVAKLGFDLMSAMRVFEAVSVFAAYLAVYGIWRRWADENQDSGLDSPVVLAAVLVALSLTDGLAFWGFSGLETPLFMALLTSSAYLYLRERRNGGLPWSAAALAATAMTRPEGLIAAAVTGAFTLAGAFSAADRGRARRALAWAAVFAVLWGSYFLWRYAYYDYLFPNTFYAKVGLTSAVFNRGLAYVTDYGLRYHLLVMFGGAAVLLGNPRLRGDVAYVLAIGGAMLLGVVIEGGDSFSHGRFVVPLLPLLFLAGISGLATLVKRVVVEPRQAAIVAVVALSLGGLSLLPSSYDALLPIDRQDHQERRLLGRWLNDNTPPDYTIAAFAVGAIAYYSERDMLDLLGINDVTIAHTEIANFGQGIAGHERYNIDYTLDVVQPEIIVFGDAEPGPLTTAKLRARTAGPGGLEVGRALFHDPRLWERYQVRSVNIEGRWFNFLQRTDTIGELPDQERP